MSLMSMFEYLNGVFCIRDSKFYVIHDAYTVNETDPKAVHLKLLNKLYWNNVNAVMVYENELIVRRRLGDITNNEIKNFMTSNSDWDVILLSPFTGLSYPIEGYSILQQVNSNQFDMSSVYIVSRRGMAKLINNMSNLNIFVYLDNFLDNMKSAPADQHHYTVGQITNIGHLERNDAKYTWVEFHV
jgi:hypothetical protein